jgi:hypothetical protein
VTFHSSQATINIKDGQSLDLQSSNKRQNEHTSWIRQFCTFLSQDEVGGVPKDELRAHKRPFNEKAAVRTRAGRVTRLAPG